MLKIIINPNLDNIRFEREVYCYSALTKQYPFLTKYFARLFNHDITPIPYLLIEEVPGKSIGDWFMLKQCSFSEFRLVVEALTDIHPKIKLPTHFADSVRSRTLKKYFYIDKHINRTLHLFEARNRNLIIQYLNESLRRAESEWKKLKLGFVFNDFSPSNIFIDKSKVKIVDLESISMGPISFDLSLLAFASLNTVLEKEVFSLCNQISHEFQQKYIFSHFCFMQILTNAYKLQDIESPKYNKLIDYLTKL